ncbi:MAG: bifunctional oligoribonuclease/PAP phosphatase NrnA [Candidatus Margulisiibacteriota bacterium]
MKHELEQIKSRLKDAKTAIVTGHIDPDGDAIGSVLALGMALEQQGINVTLYCQDSLPKVYRFLPGFERIKREILMSQRFDLGFVLDSSDLARAGHKLDLRQVTPFIINIDHHPDNTNFGDLNYVRNVSSAAELVYNLVVGLDCKIDRKMAECLYAAIITDTGNFRYENTTVKTFLIAAELLKAGVSPHDVSTRIYDTKSVPSIKLSGRILADMQFSPDGKLAWGIVTEKMLAEAKAKPDDLTGVVDRIRATEGVEVAILFREEKGKTKINFRSKEKVNVSEIARRFGGGGHVKASGAVVEGPGDEVVAKVVAEAAKIIKASQFLV